VLFRSLGGRRMHLNRQMSQQHFAQQATTDLSHRMRLDIYSNPTSVRKTSIVCTISPSNNSVELLTNLRVAGMNIVRLNLSHGTLESHAQTVANLEESVRTNSAGRVVAIAIDTQGRAIRSGTIKDGREFELSVNADVLVTADPQRIDDTNESLIFLDSPHLIEDISIGSVISVDTGLSLKVIEKIPEGIQTKVVSAGKLVSRHEIYRSEGEIHMPVLTEQDRKGIQWAIEKEIDIVFASSVRTAADVNEVREALGVNGKGMRVIAKINSRMGLDHFDEILQVADGIMISRGALAMDIPAEKVFVAQKMMIAKCNLAGKPVICATQMLDSMVLNPRPTRAETSDVANAVLDGADCVMLAGETAKGKYPLDAVRLMSRVCLEAERVMQYDAHLMDMMATLPPALKTEEAIALSAVVATLHHNCKAIVTLTNTGDSVRLLAKYMPPCPIIVTSRDPQILRQMRLHRGTVLFHYPQQKRSEPWQLDVEERVMWTLAQAKKQSYISSGDSVVLVHGSNPAGVHISLTDFHVRTVE